MFDRRIEVWAKTPGAANGFGEKLNAPQKVFERWASVGARAAQERMGMARLEATRLEATRMEVFTVRYDPETMDLTPAEHFILYRGRSYNLRSVTEVGFAEQIDIMAEAEADLSGV